MNFSVGDKVIIVRKRYGDGWNPDGDMNKYIGKIMTIENVYGNCYQMKEDKKDRDGIGWYWYEHMVGGLLC